MRHLSKAELWDEVKDYIFITLGIAIYSAGWTTFLLPYKLTGGGVAGIGAIVYYATGLPMQYTFFGINAVLLIIALKVLGFKFMLKTIYGIFAMSFILGLFQDIMPHDANGQIVQLMGPGQEFMGAILGAVLGGIGIGVVFQHNGSTGGTDIVTMILNKYRDISLGRATQICDFIIVSSSYFVFGNWETLIFGYVILFIMGYAVDYYMNASLQSVQFFIISEKYDEIANYINQEVNRGCTVIEGEGWYSKQPRKVLLVIAKKRESVPIFRCVRNIDPKAFISQSNVAGVFGEGFRPLTK